MYIHTYISISLSLHIYIYICIYTYLINVLFKLTAVSASSRERAKRAHKQKRRQKYSHIINKMNTSYGYISSTNCVSTQYNGKQYSMAILVLIGYAPTTGM